MKIKIYTTENNYTIMDFPTKKKDILNNYRTELIFDKNNLFEKHLIEVYKEENYEEHKYQSILNTSNMLYVKAPHNSIVEKLNNDLLNYNYFTEFVFSEKIKNLIYNAFMGSDNYLSYYIDTIIKNLSNPYLPQIIEVFENENDVFQILSVALYKIFDSKFDFIKQCYTDTKNSSMNYCSVHYGESELSRNLLQVYKDDRLELDFDKKEYRLIETLCNKEFITNEDLENINSYFDYCFSLFNEMNIADGDCMSYKKASDGTIIIYFVE